MPPCPDDVVVSSNPHPWVGPALWMILTILGLIAIFDIWALAHNKDTISEWVYHRPRWFKWLVGGGLVMLAWHWLKTFPW